MGAPARLVDSVAVGVRLLDETGKLQSGEVPIEQLEALTSLFVIDLEMSGSNPQTHEILDIGGVRVTLKDGLPEERSWSSRVKPRHIGNAIPAALKVSGYSPKAWAKGIDIEPAMAQFAATGAGAIITGWGIGQDMAFLVEAFKRRGEAWPFAPMAIDVQLIARKVLSRTGGDVDRFNLGHVADRLGIGRMGEHGALEDAYATYDVLVKLLERSATPST